MITAKFSVPEKVVCDGFAGKLITLISDGEMLNPHYINLNSVSSTWNTTRPCRTEFLFFSFSQVSSTAWKGSWLCLGVLEAQCILSWLFDRICWAKAQRSSSTVQKALMSTGIKQREFLICLKSGFGIKYSLLCPFVLLICFSCSWCPPVFPFLLLSSPPSSTLSHTLFPHLYPPCPFSASSRVTLCEEQPVLGFHVQSLMPSIWCQSKCLVKMLVWLWAGECYTTG